MKHSRYPDSATQASRFLYISPPILPFPQILPLSLLFLSRSLHHAFSSLLFEKIFFFLFVFLLFFLFLLYHEALLLLPLRGDDITNEPS